MHRRSVFPRISPAQPSSATVTDEGVLRALRSGQNMIWQEFLNRWSPRLYSYALYSTHSTSDAQQLLQTAFVSVTQTILQSRHSFNLSLLLVSALYRALLQYQRKAGLPTQLPDHAPRLPGTEERQFTKRFMELTAVARHVLLLRYVVGLDVAELTTVTGQSARALRQTLQSAAAALHPFSNS